MIDTTELHEFLLEKLKNLEGISPPGHFTDDGPPDGTTTTNTVGQWLWIKVRLVYEGRTMDRTSGVSGDPYEAHTWYDWIGKADSAPAKVTHPKDLEKWALVNTYYLCEYTDVGIWGVHDGRYVSSLEQDGTVQIRTGRGRFQDVAPESLTEVEEIKLDTK
ncbi:MAG: hypothetical protein RTU30_06945 [Candidatus Thorarchaeota archaeon]